MERAYLNRDPAHNGLFFVGVRTTAIFCRPTCPARSPLPKNVEVLFDRRGGTLCRLPAVQAVPADGHRRSTGLGGGNCSRDVERDPVSRITESDLRRQGSIRPPCDGTFLRHYGMTFQALPGRVAYLERSTASAAEWPSTT